MISDNIFQDEIGFSNTVVIVFERAARRAKDNRQIRLETKVCIPRVIKVGWLMKRNSWIEHVGHGTGNGHYVAYRDIQTKILKIDYAIITEYPSSEKSTSKCVTLVTYLEHDP